MASQLYNTPSYCERKIESILITDFRKIRTIKMPNASEICHSERF